MKNYQTMFNRIKEEHVNIRNNIKLVGDTISDREALNDLSRIDADSIQRKPEIMAGKKERLRKILATLNEGLRNHFAFEAYYFPPFIGKWLMLAISLEHHGIEVLIREVEEKIADTKFDESRREKLLSEEAEIQRMINKIGHALEEHSKREEMLLNMVEKGLWESREMETRMV